MSRVRARRVPGTRLALRIYVVILLAFVSIAVVLVVVARVRHARRWPGPADLGPYLAQLVASQHSNPQAMRRELDRALHDMGIEITVYTADGKLLGSAAKSPPPPGPPGMGLAPRRRNSHRQCRPNTHHSPSFS